MFRRRGNTGAATKARLRARFHAFSRPGALPAWFAPVVLLAGSATAYAAPPRTSEPSAPKPEVAIRVAPLGYRAPGPIFLLSQMSLGTLDFIDSRHLLFTFHEMRLLRRVNHDSSGEEQMIHALVLDLPDGHVSASADWLLNDRDRYLWPLNNGRFLLREGETYYTTDASLKLHVLVGSPTPVRSTEVSADGHLLVVEDDSPEERAAAVRPTLAAEPANLDTESPEKQVQVALLDIDTKAIETAFRVDIPIVLPVTSTGFVIVHQVKDDDYQLSFVPFQGKRVALGSVASTCTPHENFLSSKALLIESCGPNADNTYLDAWTVEGKSLWRGLRDGHAVWPTFATAENGSRFAVGLLQASHLVTLVDSLDDEDVKQQLVQVFDTQTGTLLLSTNASPILSAGQNFALSADGSHLAVLRNGAIEIYEVPAKSPAPPSGK